MATVVSTIKPLGGGDFLNIQAAVAARKGNLIARGTIERFELYAGGDLGALLLLPTDWTTDVDHYVEVICGPDQGHAGIYDESKVFIHGVTDNPIWIKVGYTRIGPGISVLSEADVPEIFGNPHGVIVSDIPSGGQCIIEGVIAKSTTGFRAEYCDVNVEHVFQNCIALKKSGSVTGFRATNATIRLQHCASILTDVCFHADNDEGAFGPPAAPGKVITENCYAAGAVVYLVQGTGSSIVKGAADATSNSEATDPTLRDVSMVSAGFLNPNPGFEDLHLLSTSPLRGRGVASSLLDDNDLHARPTSCADVGPFQYTAPTEVVKSVGPGGDYASWAAWVAARKGNLGVRDTVEVVEVMGGMGGIVGAALDARDWGVNLKNRVWIRAKDGHQHRGIFDSTNKAYFKNASGTRDALRIAVPSTILGPGIQLENTFYSPEDPHALHLENITYGGPILIDAVLMKNAVAKDQCAMVFSTNCTYDPTLPHRIRSSLAFTAGGNTAAVGLLLHGRWKVQHVVVFAFGAAARGIVSDAGFVDCENCYIASSQCYATQSGGTVNRGSHDATENAEALTPSLRNLSRTVVFLDGIPAGYPSTAPDVHIAATSPLYRAGADLSLEVPTDFEGDGRMFPFDIGADELYQYVAGGYDSWKVPTLGRAWMLL